jgi:hypothetical protein
MKVWLDLILFVLIVIGNALEKKEAYCHYPDRSVTDGLLRRLHGVLKLFVTCPKRQRSSCFTGMSWRKDALSNQLRLTIRGMNVYA